MTRKTDGGKGSKRRNENTAAVEANWPTNWNARVQDVPSDQGEVVCPESHQTNEARGH